MAAFIVILSIFFGIIWYRPPQYRRGLKHIVCPMPFKGWYRPPQYQKLKKIDFIYRVNFGLQI